jgi:hypothetical protein
MTKLRRAICLKLGPSKTQDRPRRRASLNPTLRGVEVLEGRQLLSTFALAAASPVLVHGYYATPAQAQKATVPSVTFYNAKNTTDASQYPISGWQGIKASDTAGQYLITGTSGATGILYVGTISGQGTSYPVNYPGASQTSVYGVANLGGNQVQLVGSYVNPDSSTRHGFFFQGTYGDGGVTGTFSTLDVPGATFNYIHSTMGGLAVGNSDGPTATGAPLGPGTASIWNVQTGQVVANVKFPFSKSNTAYGIWYNGGTSYTIVGGFSRLGVNNMSDQTAPIGTGYIVDYNSATGRFTHWKALTYPNGFNLLTHFEGISSTQPGVYQLAADSIQIGTNHITQGSWVTLARNRDGSFGKSSWVNLNYPGVQGWTSNDSVAGNQAVGIVIGNTGELTYQATVNTPVLPTVNAGRLPARWRL